MGPVSQDRAPRYAAVHILDISYPADRPYTYRIEQSAEDEIVPGCFVAVPFGGGNRGRIGYVSKVFSDSEESVSSEAVKPIHCLISREFVLSEDQQALCTFLCEMTFCTVGDAARALVPPGVLNRLVESYSLGGDPQEAGAANSKTAESLIRLLQTESAIRKDRLERQYGLRWVREADRLVRQGILTRRLEVRPDEERPKEGFVSPSLPADVLSSLASGDAETRKRYSYRRRAERFSAVLSAVCSASGREQSFSEIIAACSDLEPSEVREAIRELVADGFLTVRYGEPLAPDAEKTLQKESAEPVRLNPEQQRAFEALREMSSRETASAALLYGVTGSGKSLVIRSIAESVIASGRQVILLVPEIALTPQSVAVYCSYFGNRAAVLHSALSAGERADVWRKARSGAVDLVIGTRSAVFTPFERLGLIVIDEEQEHTYKSDQSPRYHARDVARFRCAASRALLLLASATPSFESYYKAERGAYTLLRLTERYGGASLPDVVLDDIRGEITRDGNEPLGKTLSNYLTDTIQKGEQAVFFLNRRGYHKYLFCLSCRQTVFCEHCSIPMTLHSGKGARKEETDGIPAETSGVLVCHYCGARRKPPAVCPSCSSPHLQAFGYGTQRVEEELAERFPSVRTLRMDLDTTQGKDAHERILQRFRNREADLLLGTQMVTKGHDFPDVTLVGVIAADALLSQDDFRASERTFALLTQVIGRAGRSDRRGVAVIQTYRPENEVFRLAAKQDYETFYRKHIGFRKEMVYPPFCDIVLFSASGKEEREVRSAADQLAERIASETAGDGRFSNIGLSMFGPFEAPVYRVREQYRMQIILKCRLNSGTRTFLAFLLRNACNSGRVSIVLDCNPTNL